MNNSRFISLIVSSALAISLSACNTTPTPTSSAQLVSGPITALSANSLTVSGKTFSLNSVTKSRSKAETHVSVNGNAAKPGALSVGQHVTVKADGSDATDVDVDLELKGVISNVVVSTTTPTDGTAQVAETTVIISSATRIDLSGDDDQASSTTHTIADLAALPAGTFVEVTGTTDATSGNVTASKIEVKNDKEIGDDGEDKDTEVKGAVTALTATSFTLGAVTVNCSAPCTLPEGLKNGDLVEAEGVLDAAGLTLTASKVHIEGNEHPKPTPGSSVVLDRKIRSIDLSAKTFKLCELTVDYANAKVTLIAPATDLMAKNHVKVEGTIDATDAKLVHATTVTVLPDNEAHDDGSHGDHGHHGGGNGGVPGTGGNPENPGKK